jgi:hypothetical protein
MTLPHCLSLTRHHAAAQTLHTSAQTAIQRLQNPACLIRLNPLVVDFTASPADPHNYTITNRLTVLGGILSFLAQFTAKFVFVEDGVNVLCSAAFGTRLHNRYRVQAVDGTVQLSEGVTVKVNGLLAAP